jgi:hypothetical protein
MAALTFDTLRFVRTLRDKAKMPAEQAEAFADALSDAMGDDLVTKTFLESQISQAKLGIVQWIAGLMVFQTLTIIGSVLALLKYAH